jgi:hypothetical protein
MLIRKFADEMQEFEIDLIAFASLDHFDGSASRKGGRRLGFMGPIAMSDVFQVWGYGAMLGYEVILLTQFGVHFAEGKVGGVCYRIRDVLFDAVTDPFYEPFSAIDSPRAVARIDAVSGLLSTSVPRSDSRSSQDLV